MPTLREVAEHAGVSFKTVSRVVNKEAEVRDSTREKVEKSIKALGYRPNQMARSLKTNKTGNIGVISDNLSLEVQAKKTQAVQEALHEAGYKSLIAFPTEGSKQIEVLERMLSSVEGVVFLVKPSDDVAELIKNEDRKFVFIDSCCEGYHSVQIDRGSGVIEAFKSNMDCYDHFIFVGNSSFIVNDKRFLGFSSIVCETLGEQAMSIVDCKDLEEAYRAALKIEGRCYIQCMDDRIATAVCRGLYEKGIKVPEQMAVVGFDDDAVSAFQMLPLSSISQNTQELADTGVGILVDLIGGRSDEVESTVVQTKYVPRSTTHN